LDDLANVFCDELLCPSDVIQAVAHVSTQTQGHPIFDVHIVCEDKQSGWMIGISYFCAL
jgi:hypothetical protein